MTSFRAMTKASISICKILHGSTNDRYLSYLPVAHGMERWLGEVCIVYQRVLRFYMYLYIFIGRILTRFECQTILLDCSASRFILESTCSLRIALIHLLPI